jgi:glutathione S-transferase
MESTDTNNNNNNNNNNEQQPIIIYAILGSQYVFKVLAALQAYRVEPHYVHFVPTNEAERAKVIPSGGLLVPEMQIVLGGKEENNNRTIIVSDSEAILEYLCEQGILPSQHLYPTNNNDAARQVSKRASTGSLAAMVWYYNWVEPNGYTRSMRRQIGTKVLPWFVPLFVLDFMVKSVRTKMEGQVLNILSSPLPNNNNNNNNNNANAPINLKDEPAMRQILKEELQYFESLLETDEQPFLIQGTTEPSAADFSTYSLMERLVGSVLDDEDNNPIISSDYPIFPSVPEIKTENSFQLDRLWKWHDRMRTNYKVQFKGRRVPKEMLSQL